MTLTRLNSRMALALAVAVAAILALFAATAFAQLQFKPIGRFGGQVNRTEALAKTGAAKEDVCMVESDDECQRASAGSADGWFGHPRGVAVNQATGDVYVADGYPNDRIEEFNDNVEFQLAFGSEGEGAINDPVGAALEQSTGDLYVVDGGNHRVVKFAPDGEFLLTFGDGVNEDGADVCVKGEKCQAGTAGTTDGSFDWETSTPSTQFIAVGEEAGVATVYVADRARIQEFEAAGAWKASISLASLSSTAWPAAIAVDASGHIFVQDGQFYEGLNPPECEEGGAPGVRELEVPAGAKGEVIPVQMGEPFGDTSQTTALALGAAGQLVLSEVIPIPGVGLCQYLSESRARVYQVGSHAKPLYEFGSETIGRIYGMSFDEAEGRLYASDDCGSGCKNVTGPEVEIFELAPYPTEITGASSSLKATSVTLAGEVNAESATLTAESFFEYGPCATLAECAYAQKAVTTPSELTGTSAVGVQASPTVWPNQHYAYRLAATNKNGTSHGEEASLTTPPLPPLIEGTEARFVTRQSAVLEAKLNPENAKTEYDFEYGPCAKLAECAGSVQKSEALSSAAYGLLPVAQELSGLQPGVTYSYRLVAVNEHHERSQGQEETLRTAAPPVPGAETGGVSDVGLNGATISGTVQPGGVPTSYSFEVGASAGVATIYGVVGHGDAGSSTGSAAVSVRLSGLQPGTAYLYRISARNAYGEAVGIPASFTTAAAPETIQPPSVLAQLLVPPCPSFCFPNPISQGKRTGKSEQQNCRAKAKQIKHAKKRVKVLKRCVAKGFGQRNHHNKASTGHHKIKAARSGYRRRKGRGRR